MLRSRLAALLVPALGLTPLVVPSVPAQAARVAPAGAATASRAPEPVAPTRVLAISVDGLNPDAIDDLGSGRAPAFHRLLRQGAATLNARTQVEMTVTLPNHTSMVTGRRINKAVGGHGVTWNDEIPGSRVQKAAGHPVGSVFKVVHRTGGGTALFSTKSKFMTFKRSWPKAIDRAVIDGSADRLVDAAIDDLLTQDRAFTFLHTSLPDAAGHAHGGMSSQYVEAVRRTDVLLGRILDAVDAHPALASRLVVVLTADHGFKPGSTSHSTRTDIANYRVPFVVWGAGVTAADLYALNPDDYADPGTRRVLLKKPRQPVRNGDLANLSLDILGLPPVKGSLFDLAQTLDWTVPAPPTKVSP